MNLWGHHILKEATVNKYDIEEKQENLTYKKLVIFIGSGVKIKQKRIQHIYF